MANAGVTPNLRMLGNSAIIGVAYYLVSFVLLHFLRNDVNPISEMSNEYAFGPYRFFMITAYIAVAVASLAVTLGLKHVPAGQKLISAGRYFLFFWILGLLIASILPIFADLENQTLMAKIYQINAPAHILFFTIGAVLVSIGLRREESWQPIQGLLLGISVLMIILFVIVGITTATNAGFAGLGQRLFILSTMTWLILVAAKFRTAYSL